MPETPVESLVLEASVLDDYSGPLEKLERQLLEIEAKATEVFPIDVDVRGAGKAIGELEAVEQAANRLDDANVDVDSETLSPSQSAIEAGDVDVDPETRSPSQSAIEAALETASIDRLDAGEIRTSGGVSLRRMFSRAERRGELSDLFPEGSLIENLGGAFPSSTIATEEGIPVLRGVDMETKREFFGIDPSLEAELAMPGPFDDDGFDDLLTEFKRLQFTSGSFHQTLAALIPLLAVFVGALPAAIAGLVSLAGAAIAAAGTLAAIGGLSLLGMGMEDGEFSIENLQNQLAEIREEFMDAFRPLAEDLAPLAEDASMALERMFEDLAARAQFLLSLTDDVRGVVDYFERTVPEVLDKIARFGAAALPIFGALDAFLADLGLIKGFADVLAMTLPLLMQLGNALARIIPPLIDVSAGFLLVATGILHALGIFFDFLDAIPLGLELFGVMAAVLLTLVTVTSLYSLAANSALVSTLEFASGLVTSAVPALSTFIASETAATVATWGLWGAITALLSLTGIGFFMAISSAATAMGEMNKRINEATDSLREFGAVSNRLDGTEIGVHHRRGQGHQSASGPGYERARDVTVVAPDKETGNAVANSFAFTNNDVGNSDDRSNADNRRRN